MTNSRINWIDWAKVLAIFFVVFGHTPQERGSFLISYICSFHMPFFFMLSGYLSRGSIDTKANLKKHWHSLVIPYFLYNFIFYPYWIVRYFIDQHGLLSLNEVVVKPFLGLFFCQIGTPISSVLNGVTWFLVALLLMRITLNICHRFHNPDRLLLWTAIFVALLNIIAVYIHWIDSVSEIGFLHCFPFYIWGYFMKKYSLLSCCQWQNDFISGVFYLVLSIVLYIYGESITPSYLVHIIFFYFLMISACLAMAYICRLLDSYTSNFLVTFSSGTIVIMGIHWMCVGTVNFLIERMIGVSEIKYDWYVAVILAAAICLFHYPIIVLARKYFPALLGRK